MTLLESSSKLEYYMATSMTLFWVDDAVSAKLLAKNLEDAADSTSQMVAIIGPTFCAPEAWSTLHDAAAFLRGGDHFAGAGAAGAMATVGDSGLRLLASVSPETVLEFVCLVNPAEGAAVGTTSCFAADPADPSSLPLYGLLRSARERGGRVRFWDSATPAPPTSDSSDPSTSSWPRLLRLRPFCTWAALLEADVWERASLPPPTVRHAAAPPREGSTGHCGWQGFLHVPRDVGAAFGCGQDESEGEGEGEGEDVFVELSWAGGDAATGERLSAVGFLSAVQLVSAQDLAAQGFHLVLPPACSSPGGGDDDDDDDDHPGYPTPPSSPSHTGKKHGVRPRILT